MSSELIVAIVVLVVAVAAVAWWFGQRRRTERLKDRFGPEYERTVKSADDRRRAEADLESRQERVEALDIRRLSPGEATRFGERWRVVQALFVDDPVRAVEQADVLIGEVMRACGYPVGDFEQRAADISVQHPQVVDHYRVAHRIASRQSGRDPDTEALRQAFVHYRALFADLLETGDDRSTTDAPTRTSGAGTDGRDAPRASQTDAAPPAQPETSAPAEPARRP